MIQEKSSLCDYSDTYILVKGRIKITGAGTDAASRKADERGKGVIFKNCASFTYCISKINNAQILMLILEQFKKLILLQI